MLICKRLCRRKPPARLWQAFITIQLGKSRITSQAGRSDSGHVQGLSAVVSQARWLTPIISGIGGLMHTKIFKDPSHKASSHSVSPFLHAC